MNSQEVVLLCCTYVYGCEGGCSFSFQDHMQVRILTFLTIFNTDFSFIYSVFFFFFSIYICEMHIGRTHTSTLVYFNVLTIVMFSYYQYNFLIFNF